MKSSRTVPILMSLVASTAMAIPPIGINEIRVDQPGTDNDEYIEIYGPAGASLNGFAYLVIGDGAGGSGVIEAIVLLNGQFIPPNGLFVVAEPTFTMGIANLVVGANGLNFENSDNVTHLLVQGFSGNLNQDLDLNDDGVLDNTPWIQLHDRVALIKEPNPPTTTEFSYGEPKIGPDGIFVPGHIYRRPQDGAWIIGPFDPPVGLDTPGFPNPGCMGDLSGDALVNGMDLGLLLAGWNMPGPGDLDNNGITNGADLGLLLAGWGACPYEPIGVLYSSPLQLPPAQVLTTFGPMSAPVTCELSFLLGQFDPSSNQYPIYPTMFKLLTDPLDSVAGPLGELDLRLTSGPPGFFDVALGVIQIPLPVSVHYPGVDDVVPPGESGTSSEGFTAQEYWTGGFTGSGIDHEGSIELFGELTFDLELPVAGLAETVTVPVPSTTIEKKVFNLPECPADQKCNKRTACIQPVFIGTGPKDANKTGRSLAVFKAEADAIWAKACVELVWNDPIYVDNNAYKDIQNYDQPAGRTERDNLRKEKDVACCIEVYFVSTFTNANGDAHAAGDGTTVGGGTAGAKVIVSDAAINACDPDSSRVLAHELGHAMGDCPHTAATVMKPTGASPACPGLNPNTVSKAEITAVKGGALVKPKTPKEECCTSPG